MGKPDKKGGKGEKNLEVSAQDSKWAEDFVKSKNEEISFLDWVVLPKGKTPENRLLLIGKNRIYFVNQARYKIEKEGHFAELKGIESKDPSNLTISFESWNASLQTDRVDDILNAIYSVYAKSFPGMPPDKAFTANIEPSSRIPDVKIDTGICGGFIDTYKLFCDFYNSPIRLDIIWDIDKFPTNNITQFNLDDFEQPITPEQLSPLFAALRYNTYFSGLIIKNIPLDVRKTIPEIGKCLSFNKTFTKLVLSNVGLNKDSGAFIADGIKANSETSIHSIDLSRNQLDDKAVIAFANCIGNQKNGIIQLNVAHCGISKNGLSQLAQAFRKNVHTTSTLSTLNLADNHLDPEGSAALSSWLANPNKVHELNLANTNANLEVIMPALVRGCAEIRRINVFGNKIGKKAVQSLSQFVQSADSLLTLNLDNTSLSVDEMVAITQAIGGNPYLQNFDLSIAANKLGIQGAKQIAVISSSASNIVRLNLADNEFGDEGMSLVCQALANSQSLTSIDLSRNFSKVPTKGRGQAIEDLIFLISSNCPLERLSLAGSKNFNLKTDILSFIDAVATNDSLLFLDISSNQFGNKGAIAVGKMLQTNRKLEHLVWEDNGTTLYGFSAVVNGLERNKTIKEMPLPILDISNAFKNDPPEGLQKTMTRLQGLLARNQNPKSLMSGGSSSSFSQFSILSSGEREHVERLKFKIKSTNRHTTPEQKLILQDTENNDSNMAAIYGIAEAHQQIMSDEIRSKLKDLANDIMPVIDDHFRKMVGDVLGVVGERYKSLEPETIRRVNTSISFGVAGVELSTIEKILANAASAEISAKANAVFADALEITTNYIYEKLIDGLVTIVDDIQTAVPARQSVALFDAKQAIDAQEAEEASLTTSSNSNIEDSSQSEEEPKPKPDASRRGPPSRPAPGVPPTKSPNVGANRPGSVVPPSADKSPSTPDKSPTSAPSVRGGAGGSVRRGLPAGLDPSKMVGGVAGRGGFVLPPRSPQSAPKEDDPPPVANDKSPAAKGKAPAGKAEAIASPPVGKPLGGSKKNAPSVKPVPKIKKVNKPTGETENLKAIDAAIKEAPDTAQLTHATKERPMVAKNRRPPTRRPRAV